MPIYASIRVYTVKKPKGLCVFPERLGETFPKPWTWNQEQDFARLAMALAPDRHQRFSTTQLQRLLKNAEARSASLRLKIKI